MNEPTTPEEQSADEKQPAASFTGVRRERKTRLGIKIADTASRTLITVGGIGTIVAVMAVCLYLLSVVIPLFTDGELDESGRRSCRRDGQPD